MYGLKASIPEGKEAGTFWDLFDSAGSIREGFQTYSKDKYYSGPGCKSCIVFIRGYKKLGYE